MDSSTSRLRALYTELADIERQQQDKTLSHSDQQLLDQAWEDTTNQIDELEECFGVTEEEEEDWRDARVVIAEEDAPPARSVTLQSGLSSTGKLMVRMPNGKWVPAPPLSIIIPRGPAPPTAAPPPPRPGVKTSQCSCDSDGQCEPCYDEELARWNAMVDDREGCKYCSGCVYCKESGGYDGADEI